MRAMSQNSVDQLVGILLAAGQGLRFDPTGARNKLMQPIAGRDIVAVAAARNLLAALPKVIAVIRPGAHTVGAQLRAIGCEVIECPTADHGMAASLVYALSHSGKATGWVIALADMPYVQPATNIALADAIMHGASIAVPTYRGRRGNPVAFSNIHLPELLRLKGDQGARSLLKAHTVVEIAVDDAAIHHDIDTPIDLEI
jgi:molybdenum cofactor cytidylyltransferase